MSYLLDTYALIEWYGQKNPRYRPYFEPGVKKYITRLALLEFYFYICHNKDRETAERYYSHLKMYAEVVELTDDLIKKSAALRSKMMKRKKEPSYVDCVNYVAAEKVGARLLTGAREFEGMKNVEFVR